MPDASAVIDDGVFGQNDVIEGLHVGALEGMLARIPDVQGNDVQDEDLSWIVLCACVSMVFAFSMLGKLYNVLLWLSFKYSV